jgi:uncharacterized protein (TIGR03382 family)
MSFVDESVADGSPIVTRSWTFGDGATSTGATATHAYARAGEYPVSLTVTDAAGDQDVAVQLVRPELGLQPGVRYATATQGTALFFVDVPDGTTRLRVRSAPAPDGSVEVMARHADPVVLPPLYSATQPTAYGDAYYGPPEAVVTVDHPAAGRWHLAVVGPSQGVVAEVTVPSSGSGSGEPGGGGCGCGASGGGGVAALASALLLALRRRRAGGRR